ncbi:hypothetical protein NQZ68_019270 [Dissostichus eleginoides]|nr:hypothetical protein NQZ68_019270 [Dissostichus eleginoides]
MDKARTAITQHRGDPSNRRHLLDFFEIQFGLFREQTFRWVAENSLGYAAYLVAAMRRDPTGGSKDSKEHSLNKGCFKEYIELSTSASEVDDSTLLTEAVQFEEANPAARRICLPAGWTHTLPEVDQRWISKALFKWNAKGHPELEFSRVDKLWWYPPQVPLRTSKSPAQENYFGHPLLLWMPGKLWQVKLTCPHPECNQELLTSAGLQ